MGSKTKAMFFICMLITLPPAYSITTEQNCPQYPPYHRPTPPSTPRPRPPSTPRPNPPSTPRPHPPSTPHPHPPTVPKPHPPKRAPLPHPPPHHGGGGGRGGSPPRVFPPITNPPGISPPIYVPPPHHGGGGGGEPPRVLPPITHPPGISPPIVVPPPVIYPPITNPPRIIPPITNPPVLKPPPSSQYPPYTPPGGGGAPGIVPSPPEATCPINALKLGLCLDVLGGLVHVGIGDPIENICCPVIQGLLELEAAVCLCTIIRLKLLDLNVFLPLALSVLATCGLSPPPGFVCPPLQ